MGALLAGPRRHQTPIEKVPNLGWKKLLAGPRRHQAPPDAHSKMLIFHWKNISLEPTGAFYITFSHEKCCFLDKMTILSWEYV